MTAFNDTLQKAQDLVEKYKKLYQQKENNIKTLKSDNHLLYVASRLKTVFPKKQEKGRKQVEEIMRQSKEWKQAIAFDIVKLGLAFDKKKLSKDLMEKLRPYTHQEESTKVVLRDISQIKQKTKKTKNEKEEKPF